MSLRATFRVLAAVVVIAAAAVVWQSLPVRTKVFAPFDVRGTSGETVTGRSIAATVHGARLAPDVMSGTGGRVGDAIAAAGTWVVVDATVETTRDSVKPEAELIVDGNTYLPSERFFLENLTASDAVVDPGIPERGVLVFDVATQFLDSEAAPPFVLRVWVGDGRLDSRLVITVDEQDVSRHKVITLTKPKVGG